MSDRERKSLLYEQFARMGKALANPLRLELIDVLAQGERSVEDLATSCGWKLSNTSAQLKVLQYAGLLKARRSGVKIFYRLADPSVHAFVESLKSMAADALPDAEKAARDYLGDVEALHPLLQRRELAELMGRGEVVVLDVRPAEEFAAGHIDGAVSMPHDEVATRLAELPRDSLIVAYCRGRFCVMAPEAVRMLREAGFDARLLVDGWPQWHAEGLPVAS
ncbi:metalloregulator ArsR/SmtB family transcription factor [Streptosporangium sp. NPDC049046]|uniref:ArsR/SmtB family transcription factor n=1 Tax=Streptosporangium sp. NPDC049046 TaxID=3155031 RepID=UPI00341463C5